MVFIVKLWLYKW